MPNMLAPKQTTTHRDRSSDENELITFGIFDGSVEGLKSGGRKEYDRRLSEVEQLVDSVGADGVYKVLEERTLD
jgi:hypothetical protein